MSPTTSLIYPWYVTCRSFAFSGKNTVEISNQLSIHLLFATYPVSFGQKLKQRYPDPPPALLDVPKPESDNLSRLSMACPQWPSCSPQGSLRLSPATLPTARDHSWGWERRWASWQLSCLVLSSPQQTCTASLQTPHQSLVTKTARLLLLLPRGSSLFPKQSGQFTLCWLGTMASDLWLSTLWRSWLKEADRLTQDPETSKSDNLHPFKNSVHKSSEWDPWTNFYLEWVQLNAGNAKQALAAVNNN